MRRSNWKAKVLALIGILAGILAGGAAAWAAWKYAGPQYVGLAFFTVMCRACGSTADHDPDPAVWQG